MTERLVHAPQPAPALTVALLTALTLVMFACSNPAPSSSATTSSTGSSTTSAAPAATTSTTPGSTIAKAPPKTLTDSAEYAENIYDAAATSHWDEAGARLDALHTSAADYPALLGMLPDLESAVHQQDRLQAMKSSNEMTRQAAELTRDDRTSTPVEIALLDYEGRKLQIQAEEKDMTALQKTAAEIRQTWDTVHPEVEAQGGGPEATAFESQIRQLEGATSPDQYRRISSAILDQVDRLEAVFTRHPR